MEPGRTSGRRSAGARKPEPRGFPYGSDGKLRPSRPVRGRASVQLRAAGGDRRPPKQRGGGLARLGAVDGQKPARSPFEKASARVTPREARQHRSATRRGLEGLGRPTIVSNSGR